MRYLPHTADEIDRMLKVVGRKNLDELFCSIPDNCRHETEMCLPEPLDEFSLVERMQELADAMRVDHRHSVLIGGGSYHHNIPATIPALVGRSEFLTAYTPYQAEMAQGTLQSIFEYQTLTSRLLGMDVANASMYDGASALAEALLMGLRISRKKKKVAISSAVHPHYRQVVATYLKPTQFEIVELPVTVDGRTDLSGLAEGELAAVAIQSPNFYGVVEDLTSLGETIHDAGALFVTCFTEAMAYGMLKSPGECGADIVCGEGQSFGMPRSFGGAALGMFGCKDKYVRNMPGRLVGETVDLDGNRGFVLTLATREQHIRREKATSNICSNQGICTVIATMYMASLGGTGLRKLARLNYDKAQYFKNQLLAAGGREVFSGPTFNEFVMDLGEGFGAKRAKLMEEGIVAGVDLGRFDSGMAGKYLFCATETAKKEILDRVVEEVKS